ncbi:MAG: glycosyltransferase family 4 protein [Desulfobacterales bacterium]|nr:glycosyltransferase family 4 protein [Desulfobacterales bacterium]
MRCLYPIEGTGGGAVTHALTLAEHLPKHGIQPILAFFLDGPSVNKAQDLRLDYRLVPWRFGLDFTLAWRLNKILREEDVDIIHTHTITGSFYSHMANFLYPQRLLFITTVHSFIIDELEGHTGMTFSDWSRYKRDLYLRRFVDQFIVVSDHLQNTLRKDGVPENKIVRIRHGIGIPNKDCCLKETAAKLELNIGRDKVVVGTVGRLVEVKNHKLFLKAAKRVLTSVQNIAFLIVGDGPLRQSLERLAQDLCIEDSVIFVGWQNEIGDFLKTIDIFVSCSITESQGLAILEAMAVSKPVIAADVNQLGETVIDGKTGLLIASNDLDGLVNAILTLVSDVTLRNELGRAGRQLVEGKHSIERMVRETAELYTRLYKEKCRQQSTRKGISCRQ